MRKGEKGGPEGLRPVKDGGSFYHGRRCRTFLMLLPFLTAAASFGEKFFKHHHTFLTEHA
jgi:hypothetical protein